MDAQLIYQYIISSLAVLIILPIHEFSHGYVAYKLGDPTAKAMGRLTLNPIRHLDLFGAICMVLFRFGWAKPVPVDVRYFKKPKRDFAIVALAGPLSNIVCAFFGAFLYLVFYKFATSIEIPNEFVFHLLYYTLYFLLAFHQINLGFAIFNLIPIPPLDGSRLLAALLPNRIYYKLLKYERQIYIVMLVWLFLGRYASEFLLSMPLVSTNPVLTVLANVLSLSSLISALSDKLSALMISFWNLLPFLR